MVASLPALAFLGAGSMGGAILRGVVASGIEIDGGITATNRTRSKANELADLPGVRRGVGRHPALPLLPGAAAAARARGRALAGVAADGLLDRRSRRRAAAGRGMDGGRPGVGALVKPGGR